MSKLPNFVFGHEKPTDLDKEPEDLSLEEVRRRRLEVLRQSTVDEEEEENDE